MEIVFITDVGDRLQVLKPIQVKVEKVQEGSFKATGVDLGMWYDGIGKTSDAAVEDLREAIVSQHECQESFQDGAMTSYALGVREIFRTYLAPVAAPTV